MKVRRHYEEEVECVGEVEGRCELKGGRGRPFFYRAIGGLRVGGPRRLKGGIEMERSIESMPMPLLIRSE
jgi:hypothetical protein